MTDFRAFKAKASGIINALVTPVKVFEAFDPQITPHPSGADFNAIWDTGATNTVISQAVVDKLSLKPAGTATVFSAYRKEVAEKYFVNIWLPNQVGFAVLPVTKGKPQGGDLLIGMDIIGRGDFAVSSYGGHTQFTFHTPSLQSFDFTQIPAPSSLRGSIVPATPPTPKPPNRNDFCPCGSGKKYKKCHGGPQQAQS